MGREIRRPRYAACELSGQARENGKAWAKEWQRPEEVKKGNAKAEAKEKASGCK